MSIPEVIDEFDGPHAFLSNFHPVPIRHMGLHFNSVEAAYQASKCDKAADRLLFVTLDPLPAKRLGRKIENRADWPSLKLGTMRDLLHKKFQFEELKVLLLNTGDAELVEGNSWGDVFWGVCSGIGENHLGRLLMQVRDDLRRFQGERA